MKKSGSQVNVRIYLYRINLQLYYNIWIIPCLRN
nr:MAG TPA: hypothetical protein [Caudoviricetes sp.]